MTNFFGLEKFEVSKKDFWPKIFFHQVSEKDFWPKKRLESGLGVYTQNL
jgi:hypothetical protein